MPVSLPACAAFTAWRRPRVRTCTSPTRMIPPYFCLQLSRCLRIRNLHFMTPQKQHSSLPYQNAARWTERCWQHSSTLSALHAFLSSARRKPDRKDEPSKIPPVRKTGDVPILVLGFLLEHPSRANWLTRRAFVYVLFFFFFLLMRVACFFFRYLLWDLRAKRRMGNCRGCSLEFPACCRVGRRACPGRHPPRRARPLQPAPSCLRWPMCVRACVGWMSGKASDTAEGGDEQQA